MQVDPLTAIEQARRTAVDQISARRILTLLDVTNLRGDQTPQQAAALARRALVHGCAGVCLPPRFLSSARDIVAGSAVRLATVVNFPEGSDDLARVWEETRTAVSLGANEIEAVAPLSAVLAGDVELVGDLVRICRDAAGPKHTLKIILETDLLARPTVITAAARAAVMAGADVLTTSTGTREPGATLEAAALLLAVIREADGHVGLKVSGGIRTLADAAPYLALSEAVMGPRWVNTARLRFGASRLLDELELGLGR